MKNSKAAYSYFAMHFPAASEGSSGPYENLRLTALFAVVFLYRSTKSCEVL